MAVSSTIFKVAIQIADIDHGYYADHALTLARHPSETDERMMVRMLAFALQAHKLQSLCRGDGTLAFGAGLSDPNEPDVWLKDFSGATRVWVEVGQPDEKPILKACGKAQEVHVYAFHHASDVWWKGIQGKLVRAKNLRVYQVPAPAAKALQALAQRSMNVQATIQEGVLSLSSVNAQVSVEPVKWL